MLFRSRFWTAAERIGLARNAVTEKHASAFWSAVTCHRFGQATCRRWMPVRPQTCTHAPPLARAVRAPIVPDMRGRSTATSRLGKAVTSHRTPKRASEPRGVCVGNPVRQSDSGDWEPSRNRLGRGMLPNSKGSCCDVMKTALRLDRKSTRLNSSH